MAGSKGCRGGEEERRGGGGGGSSGLHTAPAAHAGGRCGGGCVGRAKAGVVSVKAAGRAGRGRKKRGEVGIRLGEGGGEVPTRTRSLCRCPAGSQVLSSSASYPRLRPAGRACVQCTARTVCLHSARCASAWCPAALVSPELRWHRQPGHANAVHVHSMHAHCVHPLACMHMRHAAHQRTRYSVCPPLVLREERMLSTSYS